MHNEGDKRLLALSVVAIGLIAPRASADVQVDVEPYTTAASGRYESLLEFIEFQIEQGFVDNGHRVFTAKAVDGDVLINDGRDRRPVGGLIVL